MEQKFSTNDLYLASSLKSVGLELLDAEIDPSGRGVFVFRDRQDRAELVRKFFSDQLSLNVRSFIDHWMSLKKLVSISREESESENGKSAERERAY